ncbi:M14 family metallopeptidase [Jiangella sp. DSM 45060]|uniref:M14 family metallopeptidase n=1 Tax=Jiangella sp. DSM 45060 TaxID=1798224 RepID=UPI0008798CFE|nr:M14 family metallopeptidase [Jiangella sp. DSM 45060]SDT42503.1 Immune inhibitor A peptidase M6 [Jiangella sp. DSM 45060]
MAASRRSSRRLTAAAATLGLGVSLLVTSGAGADDGGELEAYTADVTAQQAAEISADGLDVTAAEPTASGVHMDLVLTEDEVRALRGRGVDVVVKRNADGLSATEAAARQAAAGYTVWRSWDEDGGLRDQLYDLAKDNPQIAKLVVLGKTYEGREIIALKLTQGARGIADGTRPAVLYSSLQHAREWISGEVNRRMLTSLVDGWRANDREVRGLLRRNEYWFVLVANPDGYQYTFDAERLWRKNLRDNDGDGTTTALDGVDPNRNYPEHFRYDEEGSSSLISSDTYRGPEAASEPETQAMLALYDRVDFAFHVNWHSAGEWLLYPEGWQTGTPSADDPIYFALSGNLDTPAIPGWEPGLSSDVLYVTNGETTDFAHAERGTLAWTPELGEGVPGSGFVFPDDEALVQAEFEKVLPFAMDVARSAADPDDPVSHLGLTTKPFYLRSDDTYKAGLPQADFTFDYSYGDPQEVRVLAKRDLGDVTVKYRVDGGPVQSAPTEEWDGGDRYGGGTDVYYRVMSGVVTGTDPGDTVEVWFEGGGQTSDSFTYTAVSESGDEVLVLAAEDYTGASPVQAGGPNHLAAYEEALTANGVGYDVYDVDARGRTAPDALGVLSHYDAVVWYTGDDIVTREPGWAGGNASRLAMDELLEVRDFLNEGGQVLYTGKYAGSQYTQNLGLQAYDPTAANAQCSSSPVVAARCRVLAGSGDLTNDVLQYWLGAYLLVDDAGTTEDGLLDVIGGDEGPFEGLGWGFDPAGNQDHSNSQVVTSGILDPETYPQFDSWVAARWDREGGPFEPHTGDFYVYSQIGDVSFKRLTNTVSVPAGGATLSFWTSYDTEADWDHLFVEAAPAGTDDWTTLPELNGHTTQDIAAEGSCTAGWNALHPQLEHYQTVVDGDTCLPTGTTGEWNAASGNSGGWQQWSIDLSAYAGGDVELSISYASDWAVQGLGVFVDDITVSTGDGDTSFETDLGGWEVPGPPEGSAPNANDFVRTTAGGFPEAAVTATPGTLYAGFGLEGIEDAAERAAVMERALKHLLD